LLVKPPSLKTGSPKRFVVTIGTTRPVFVQGLLELVDDPLPLGAVTSGGNEVVVVESDPVRAKLGELVDRFGAGKDRTSRLPEHVSRLPTHGPEPETELVLACRCGCHFFPPVGVVAARRLADWQRQQVLAPNR
jgi:hypothetical protein